MTVSIADACENTDAQARMQACNHNGFKVSLLIVGMSIAHVLVWFFGTVNVRTRGFVGVCVRTPFG